MAARKMMLLFFGKVFRNHHQKWLVSYPVRDIAENNSAVEFDNSSVVEFRSAVEFDSVLLNVAGAFHGYVCDI